MLVGLDHKGSNWPLNVNLLKPERESMVNRLNVLCVWNSTILPGWVQYKPRLECPLLRHLTRFLATFIVETFYEALDLPLPRVFLLQLNPENVGTQITSGGFQL